MQRGTSILLYTWLPKRVSRFVYKISSQTISRMTGKSLRLATQCLWIFTRKYKKTTGNYS